MKGEHNMKRKILILAGIGIILLLSPLFINNEYYLHIMITMYIYCILSVSLNLIVGYAGQFSMGHAAFCGIGAYATAILMKYYIPNFFMGILLSILIAGIAGFLLGLSTARLFGDYFGIVTLGFGEIIRQIMINWTTVTKGPMGIPGIPTPTILGHNFSEKIDLYYLGLILLLITVYIAAKVVNSGVGLKLALIREDELAAKSIGISPAKEKLKIITLGCAMAGAAGAFYATYSGFIYPSSFQYTDSTTLLAMVVLGGMSNIRGSILGAILLTLIPEILRPIDDYRLVLYGVIIIITVIFKPEGIYGESKRKINLYGKPILNSKLDG